MIFRILDLPDVPEPPSHQLTADFDALIEVDSREVELWIHLEHLSSGFEAQDTQLLDELKEETLPRINGRIEFS